MASQGARVNEIRLPLCVRLTASERELVMIAARVNSQKVSAFIRDAITSAAGDCLEETSIPILRLKR